MSHARRRCAREILTPLVSVRYPGGTHRPRKDGLLPLPVRTSFDYETLDALVRSVCHAKDVLRFGPLTVLRNFVEKTLREAEAGRTDMLDALATLVALDSSSGERVWEFIAEHGRAPSDEERMADRLRILREQHRRADLAVSGFTRQLSGAIVERDDAAAAITEATRKLAFIQAAKKL